MSVIPRKKCYAIDIIDFSCSLDRSWEVRIEGQRILLDWYSVIRPKYVIYYCVCVYTHNIMYKCNFLNSADKCQVTKYSLWNIQSRIANYSREWTNMLSVINMRCLRWKIEKFYSSQSDSEICLFTKGFTWFPTHEFYRENIAFYFYINSRFLRKILQKPLSYCIRRDIWYENEVPLLYYILDWEISPFFGFERIKRNVS